MNAFDLQIIFSYLYLHICICVFVFDTMNDSHLWQPVCPSPIAISEDFVRLPPTPTRLVNPLNCTSWIIHVCIFFTFVFFLFLENQWSTISGSWRISYVYLILIFIAAYVRRNINWEFQISGKTSLDVSQSWKYLALLPQLFRV